MAVMVTLEWAGMTAAQYDEIREGVGWLNEAPAGGRVHVAAIDENGGHMTDVWDSAEEFQTFVDTRLMPVVEKVGLDGAPDVRVYPLHELYVPQAETVLAT